MIGLINRVVPTIIHNLPTQGNEATPNKVCFLAHRNQNAQNTSKYWTSWWRINSHMHAFPAININQMESNGTCQRVSLFLSPLSSGTSNRILASSCWRCTGCNCLATREVRPPKNGLRPAACSNSSAEILTFPSPPFRRSSSIAARATHEGPLLASHPAIDWTCPEMLFSVLALSKRNPLARTELTASERQTSG